MVAGLVSHFFQCTLHLTLTSQLHGPGDQLATIWQPPVAGEKHTTWTLLGIAMKLLAKAAFMQV